MTVTFDDIQSLEGLDFLLPFQVKGTDVALSGPLFQLWEVLSILQNSFAEEILGVAYYQPTLDDVVLKLTPSKDRIKVKQLRGTAPL